MAELLFITHPEVVMDPGQPVARWHLSSAGIARARVFAESGVADGVSVVWASAETKAIETAGIVAARLGLGVAVEPGLGENDRSATGFLPPAEFERTADAFFARPEESVRGWERAVDAQARVSAAVRRIVAGHEAGDLAVVAHGAVGALLLAALEGAAIGRQWDQPFQGHFWRARLPDLAALHGWREIASRG
ncbi:MAG: histidine phosphatase family protein [Amaricoccus sp.]|uniref:histidine phosphatase family protein n=1 Tax=Amaricoccus sp. TaxID=1872485 RepID=UPI0039E6B20C